MYLSFYGLQKKPFQVSTDPSFLWLGEKHKEALATLKYGNLGNQGFVLLTGDVGTGKTTLINALINSLGDEVIVAKVPDPGMEIIDFMNYISHAFNLNKKFVSKDAFLIHFEHFLNSVHAAGKKCLLIIDEAQRLSPALLEEVRQLSNIEKQETKLLSIFFVAQNEFNDVLLEQRNRALRQRINLNYVIEPLDMFETGEFVRHRLDIAGAKEEIFSPDAIRKVYELSGGFPRRVNIICDHSLLLGFVKNTKTVTGEIVKECVKDLLLPEFSKNQNHESIQSIDTADCENLEDICPEHLQEVRSGRGWKTFSTVVLLAMAVFIVAFILYTGEYRALFSNNNNNEVQSYSSERGTTRLSANSYPESNQEITSAKGVGTDLETTVAGEDAQEVLHTEDTRVENVKPVNTLLADDKPVILEETTIVPDVLRKGTGMPRNGIGSGVTSSIHNISQVDSLTNLNQMNPSDDEKKKTNSVVSKTDMIVQPFKTIEPVDTGYVPLRLANLPNETVDQETEKNQIISEGSLIHGVEITPGQVDPKGDEGALETRIHDQSSELIVEEVKTTSLPPDSLAAGVSGETENEIVEPVKTITEDQIKIEEDVAQTSTNDRLTEPAPPADAGEPVKPFETDEAVNKEPENLDPGVLIDWVIENSSK
jgi:type II secretory pathway predicted ATPase ExeA